MRDGERWSSNPVITRRRQRCVVWRTRIRFLQMDLQPSRVRTTGSRAPRLRPSGHFLRPVHARAAKVVGGAPWSGSVGPKQMDLPMQEFPPRRTLILGGARSGKSEFAERMVGSFGHPKVFVATAQALDDEMQKRIKEHRERRGTDWRTVEAPMSIASALNDLNVGEVALLDCLTVWLSNQMLAGGNTHDCVDQLILSLENCSGSVVAVSNEIGQGIVPENPLTRRFRDEHGRLNQRFAEHCNLVVLVTAGLPLVLKGAMPSGLA